MSATPLQIECLSLALITWPNWPFAANLPDNASTRRRWVQMAREALNAKEAAGEVVIERNHGGWGIIEAPQRTRYV